MDLHHLNSIRALQREVANKRACLVAVSKTYPSDRISEMYDLGLRDFGENRVQELVDKAAVLPDDIRWHFIGHLQTNKVKFLASFVHLIHAVDSWKLLKEINKRAAVYDRVINVLLQFKVAEEDTKHGYAASELFDMLASEDWQNLQHVRIVGVMGMATFTSDEAQVRKEFQQLKLYFQRLKKTQFSGQPHFKEISMGMSGDYQYALEEGSTMVRIGSKIFGARG